MSDSTDAEVTNEQAAEVPEQETVETVEETGLGDAGKKALDAERKRANEAEKRLKEAADRIAPRRRSDSTSWKRFGHRSRMSGSSARLRNVTSW